MKKELNNTLINLKNNYMQKNKFSIFHLAWEIIGHRGTDLHILCNEVKAFYLSYTDTILVEKFFNFLIEIDKKTLEESTNLLCNLFEDNEKGRENCRKILSYLNKIEEYEKIDFMVNATISCAHKLVDIETYFRMMHTLANVMYQDLMYLKKYIRSVDICIGGVNAHSLASFGLMVLAEIDSEACVEEQKYAFTEYARTLDRFAISLYDDEAQKYYMKERTKIDLYVHGELKIVEFDDKGLE